MATARTMTGPANGAPESGGARAIGEREAEQGEQQPSALEPPAEQRTGSQDDERIATDAGRHPRGRRTPVHQRHRHRHEEQEPLRKDEVGQLSRQHDARMTSEGGRW